MERLDYLAVGHITRDILPSGDTTFGGTVTYSARTAAAMGCRTGVVTSGAEEEIAGVFPTYPATDIQLYCVPSERTTVFRNIYRPAGRTQFIQQVAAPIGVSDIPAGWERAGIVHLAPVAREVDPEVMVLFSDSLIGLTPQGWLRSWDESGQVSPATWPLAERYFRLAAAVILSKEDLPEEATLTHFRQWARLLVMTDGPNGCTVFMGDESRQIPAARVEAKELTGAGDIFATAFLLRLQQTRGNPWEAARFANEVAAQAVTQGALDEKIRAIQRLVQQIGR